MKTTSIILGTLLVSGFIVGGCSETPEEKVRREVKEKCEAFVKLHSRPTESKENIQRIINECTQKETEFQLKRLNQPQNN